MHKQIMSLVDTFSKLVQKAIIDGNFKARVKVIIIKQFIVKASTLLTNDPHQLFSGCSCQPSLHGPERLNVIATREHATA